MKTNRAPLPLLNRTRVNAILEKISLLGGLNESQLDTVLTQLRTLNFHQGDIIFKQNSPPSYIYIVLSGRVKTYTDHQGTPLEMRLIESGQCFGETSLMGIQPHSVTAIAQDDCELLVISTEALQALFDLDKDIYSLLLLNIARETSRNLRDSRELFIEYAMTHKQVSS